MKFKFFIKIILHLLCFVILTALTQIGGIIYLISLFIISKKKPKYRIKRILFFTFLYLTSTFLIVPNIAPFFGRVKIEDIYRIKSHNYFIKTCNRNYVTPKMHTVLTDISLRLNKEFPNVKLIYLDANFPFFDGFPLLPHLSHNDGKKIDISFVYENRKGNLTNLKPSISGYGVFATSLKGEFNQTKTCKQNGFWQYDFTKYLTFGSPHKDFKFSSIATKKLIELILKNDKTSKLFIEPHLKKRLKLNNSKIRFHGCRAVRHDDHIHLQIH